jgi:hypothetical protein
MFVVIGVLSAGQDLPREAMLYAYTINAVRAMKQEASIGSIEPGKAADFALLDRAVLTASAEQMRDTQVLGTMVADEWVYRANWQGRRRRLLLSIPGFYRGGRRRRSDGTLAPQVPVIPKIAVVPQVAVIPQVPIVPEISCVPG